MKKTADILQQIETMMFSAYVTGKENRINDSFKNWFIRNGHDRAIQSIVNDSSSQYKSRIEELEGLALLPDHYTPVQEPFFEGKGVHSVSKLEDLCEGYKEYCHQFQIKFQKSQQTIESQRKRIETLTEDTQR
jgi:hypothetical protein